MVPHPKKIQGWGWSKPSGGWPVSEKAALCATLSPLNPETRRVPGASQFLTCPVAFRLATRWQEALIHAEFAITGWIEAALDDGQDIPAPSPIDTLRTPHQSLGVAVDIGQD